MREGKTGYHDHKEFIDLSSGKERTVYYFCNVAEGFYSVLDVLWQEETYRIFDTKHKPTYGLCVNLQSRYESNRQVLKAIPYRYRDDFCAMPFDSIRRTLDALGFERIEVWEDNAKVWTGKPWSREIDRY